MRDKMIAIIDYGVGNLFSLRSSLSALGLDAVVSSEADVIESASHVILPGVGAFEDAIGKLREKGLDETVRQVAENGKPLLGICLGMQLLFERSHEFGLHEGLALLPGEICSLEEALEAEGFAYKVPHMGWNTLNFDMCTEGLLKYTKPGEHVYYVHSYYAADCDSCLVAYSDYGIKVPGVVQNGNVYGAQFHPEKSGEAGLRMLKAFSEVG